MVWYLGQYDFGLNILNSIRYRTRVTHLGLSEKTLNIIQLKFQNPVVCRNLLLIVL